MFFRRLKLDYTFHNSMMDSVEDRLRDGLGQLHPERTRILLISAVTGEPIPGDELDGDYWWRNVRYGSCSPELSNICCGTAAMFSSRSGRNRC